MAGIGAANFTSTTQCFTAPTLFQDSVELCSPYIKALQTCPTSLIAPSIRSQATNLTALCMMSVWKWDDNPVYLANYTSELPPKIQASSSCQYPDIIPIVQQACAFEYSLINVPCYNNANASLEAPTTQYTLCQTEAMIQYWRCTEQKPFDEVASCVIENADKVNWVPPIQPYSGEASCPDRTIYLVTTGISILSSFIITIISTWLGPPAWRKLKKFFKKRFMKNKSEDNAVIEKSKVWERERSYTLRAHLLLKSLGTEILVAYLTVLILQRSGAAAVDSINFAFWDAIFIFVIRPRVAPLTGVLGFFTGFSETGLADVFADSLLSWIAGSKIFINYWTFYSQAPANPAAPADDLKILAIGAIMSSTPAVLTFLFLVGASLFISGHKAGILEYVLVFFQVFLFAAVFIGLLPVVALVELLAMAIFAYRHKMQGEKTGGKREPSKWEKPLTTSWPKFRNFIYPTMVLISFIINIGNWVFFVTYLKIAGDTFCPGDSQAVEVLWVLLPLGIILLFFGFSKITE